MLKQTIILSSSINEAEKLKSLANFNEKPFSVRYMSTLSLAQYLLQLSGICVKGRFVTNDELAARLYSKIKQIDYFKAFTYSDVLNLLSSVNNLRRSIKENESDEIHKKLPPDKFVKKNEAIKDYYDLLMDYLASESLIDEVGVIRYAYENTKVFDNIDFIVYEDDPLLDNKLDKALLDKAAGKEVVASKINEGGVTKIENYTKAFSQVNEIENIINYINENKIPFDKCLIAGAEEKDYALILTNYKDLFNIPLALGVGKTIIETNPGKLFSLLNDYIKSGYHTEYLKRVVFDESFNVDYLRKELGIADDFEEINKNIHLSLDSILTTVGDLKLSFEDRDENDIKFGKYEALIRKYQANKTDEDDTNRRILELPYVEALLRSFNNGLINFISKYSLVADEVDKNALEKIVKYLDYQARYGIKKEDIIKTIFKQNVGRLSAKPGMLYFTSIRNAASCLREYLFIVGLSANNYPGSNSEDPIILDRDYKAFGINDASTRSIKNNRNIYHSLVALANKYNCHVHLSYPFYNSMTLKGQNASSVVFETYKKEYGEDKTIQDFEDDFKPVKNKDGIIIKKSKNDACHTVEYFSNDLLPISKIGQALVSNQKIEYHEPTQITGPDRKEPIPQSINKRYFSASAINLFVECPYQFFLSRIMNIPQPEEIDIFELIPANDYGTLAHDLLEHLNKKQTSKIEFLEQCKERFEEYFIIHHTDNIPLKNASRNEFIEMMSYAYDMEEKEDSFLKEEDLYCEYEHTGLRIHGFPDKVLANKDGELYVIDYKTGRRVKHDMGKPETILQCVVYSYILEKVKHKKVFGIEYRYIRLNRAVSSLDTENPDIMQKFYGALDTTMNKLKEAYDTGIFEPNTDHCDKCYYKDICTKKKGAK